MTFDVRQVDGNLQAIAAIESAWDLPALPDEVKLDLAGQGFAGPAVLAQVVNGWAEDVRNAGRQQALPTRMQLGFPEPVRPTQYAYHGKTEVGKFVAGALGMDAPQQYNARAAQNLKRQLAASGYLELSEEEIESDRWLPEFSYAARQYNFDEMTRRFQGNEPGSFSVDQIFDWVDQWLSPRGLYRAAVELDLFWDPEAIGRDFSEWGEKWSAWSDDKLNVRKLIDAVTGPLDDLLFPVLNVGLMFTGVGQVVGVGRAMSLGFKGADAVSDLYRGSKLITAGADDIARFAQPSYLSKVVGRAGAPGRGAQAAMEGWRKQNAVILAKKANQQALKAGFVSNVQAWVDSDRGGASISHWTGGAASENVYRMMSNPMLDWGVDLLFYPTNIFKPGTFIDPLRGGKEAVQRGLSKAAHNESLLHGYDRAWTQYLQETGDVETLNRYNELRKTSVHEAIKQTMFGGNEQRMGEGIAYVTVAGALDHKSRQLADAMGGDPLHRFDGKTQSLFHRTRNQLIGQLRPMDPNNVEDMFKHLATYGDNAGEFSMPYTSSAKHYHRRVNKIREGFLETAEEAAARGGAVPAGHTRYVGELNMNTGRMEWRPMKGGDLIEGDPFFVDLLDSEVLESAGEAVIRGDALLPDEMARRYLRTAEDGGLRHHRLSEAGSVRHYSAEGIERLRGIANRHNELRAKALDEIMSDLDPEAMAQYLYQVLPTMGRWDTFAEANKIVSEFEVGGQLAGARLVTPVSDSGRALSAMPRTVEGDPWSQQVFELMQELPRDERLYDQLMKSVFAPLARQISTGRGTFTIANADTVLKEDALSFGAGAERGVKMLLGIRRQKALNPQAYEIARGLAEAGEPLTSPALREIVQARLGMESITTSAADDLARSIRYAKQHGISLDDVEDYLRRDLEQINMDPRWSEKFRVASDTGAGGKDITDFVIAKVRELRNQSRFMAAGVTDVPQELVDQLAERGYRLVYGVDFMQPPDVVDIVPALEDITRKHVRQKALGDFFSRQEPEAVSALKMRKLRESLHARLSGVGAEDGKVLFLGDKLGDPSEDMKGLMTDLWHILQDQLDIAQRKIDGAGGRMWERFATRASLAHVPTDISGLASAMGGKLIDVLRTEYGYSRVQANAIYAALQDSRNLGFKTHGLYAIESKLRSANFAEGLRLFSKIEDAGRVGTAARRTVGFGAGSASAILGANLAMNDPEMVNSDAGMITRFGAAAVGGIAGAALGPRVAGRAAEFLTQSGRRVEWSYLGDSLANIRDTARFALSPIFDASRYSEAIILNQIGELPDKAIAKGLRFNQSPSAWRKQTRRALVRQGVDKDVAAGQADVLWRRWQDEFGATARGHYDFDLESHHEISRRFASVGVLGFSPTDWMTSTYAHLRQMEVGKEEAYRAVREIYTYGMTGRSAAELSMNFVFFPFSFTKKTVGHFAKFFSDDLSRLIVLQDAMASYQALNDQYDLTSVWRDRLPILQKAHRLNLLAYGIGLGQFGGVNASMAAAFGRLPGVNEIVEALPGRPELVNAFLPNMVPMESMDDTDTVWDTMRGMLPVINDVNTLIGSMVEQGYVIGSESHMTRDAEQRQGWNEWRQFQEELEAELAKVGMSWVQATRHPAIGVMIASKRTELGHKYPSWIQGMGDGIAHSNAIRMEIQERIQYPAEPADELLAQYHDWVEGVETSLGFTFDGAPERIPGAFFKHLRGVAIDYARQEPRFLMLYNRFYRRLLGDIASDI